MHHADAMAKTIHIAMWSGPRNISTTMMRSFENRADTTVIDEPFYASYLARSGVDHPFRQEVLEAQPNSHVDARRWALAENPDGIKYKFHKHIAFHVELEASIDWLLVARCFLLIRDPRAMVASYADRLEDVTPIITSYKFERRLADFMKKNNKVCPIVDAKDMLKAPEAMLRKLCGELDIPFDTAMLEWPAGKRASDGVWAPHWYRAVESSTGFRPYVESTITLTSALEDVAAACQDDYDFLSKARLTA